MDVYTGDLSQNEIFKELKEFWIQSFNSSGIWSLVGTSYKNFEVTELSDSSVGPEISRQ
jgi:hypothetical protein